MESISLSFLHCLHLHITRDFFLSLFILIIYISNLTWFSFMKKLNCLNQNYNSQKEFLLQFLFSYYKWEYKDSNILLQTNISCYKIQRWKYIIECLIRGIYDYEFFFIKLEMRWLSLQYRNLNNLNDIS